jgi:general secretion pathway protein K
MLLKSDRPNKRALGKEGVALITTLLVLGLLVASVVEFNRIAITDIEVSSHFGDDKKLLYLAVSGVNAAKQLLYLDGLYTENDSLLEQWAKTRDFSDYTGLIVQEGKMEVEITDENGKIDVNRLLDDKGQFDQTQKGILERLLREPRFGLTEEEVNTIIFSLKDWMDQDDEISGIYGAEDSFYRERGYLCKNKPLDTIEEMLLVRGVTEEIFYGNSKRDGIRNYLTVYGSGKININTAPIPVLIALSQDMSEELAMQMDSYRRDETKEMDLASALWYKKIWPYGNPFPETYLTVSSDSFSIHLKATLSESVKEVQAVVSRSKSQADIIYWQEM